MNKDDYIERREIGDYRITIYYDEWPECPVTMWDMGARYIFESDRGYLCDNCNWKDWVSHYRGESLRSILQRIAAEVVAQEDMIKFYKEGRVHDARFVYDKSARQWMLQTMCRWAKNFGEWNTEFEASPNDLKEYDYTYELLEPMDEEEYVDLIQTYAKNFVLKTWESRGNCQGDYIHGIAYTTKERFDKYCGFNSEKYKTWQEQALAIIDSEVKDIGMWAWGDVKGYVLERKIPFTKVYSDENREDEEDFEWEEVDSCWGYYLETEELIREVMSAHDIKECDLINNG